MILYLFHRYDIAFMLSRHLLFFSLGVLLSKGQMFRKSPLASELKCFGVLRPYIFSIVVQNSIYPDSVNSNIQNSDYTLCFLYIEEDSPFECFALAPLSNEKNQLRLTVPSMKHTHTHTHFSVYIPLTSLCQSSYKLVFQIL